MTTPSASSLVYCPRPLARGAPPEQHFQLLTQNYDEEAKVSFKEFIIKNSAFPRLASD